MLKVLHLDTGKELRGGQWQLLMLARSLRDLGCQQLIVSPEDSRLAAQAAMAGIDTWSAPLRGAASLGSLARLRRIIKRGGFNVVHAHDGRAQTISWLASCWAPVCRVSSRRVTFLPRFRAVHRFKYAHTCDAVIAVSGFIRNLLVESGVPASRIEVIPDGVTAPESLPGPDRKKELRRRWGLEESDFVIGHAGAFTEEKGQQVLLDAFKMAAPSLPQLRLLLAGDGPLRESLQTRWQHESGGRHVQFLGYLDDLSSLMDCLDLFVMPSLNEGLGSSAIIAMGHGVPVIASRVGGLPEVVKDGKTGWLTPPGDAVALARAIESAIADAAGRNRVRHNGWDQARLFSSAIMAERTLKLYFRLTGAALKDG
ncbi:MAG: glycosyltransferase family 4 protein [Terriglobia bacterium]